MQEIVTETRAIKAHKQERPSMVIYEFGRFKFCPREQQLLSDDMPVPLTYKAFGTLHILLSNSGKLVEKSEIMSAIWKDSLVNEGKLNTTICMIRKGLDDTWKQPRYIQTVFNRGYRFIAKTRRTQNPKTKPRRS